MSETPGRRWLAALLLAGTAVVGALTFGAQRTVGPAAADVVWVVGYGGIVLVAWFLWIRPLDLSGADG